MGTMRILDFKGEDHAQEYAERGYVVVRNGINPDFLAFAQARAREQMGSDADLEEWKFEGKKLQFLFDFPESSGYPDELFDAVAAIAGLDREKLTLCERHIKAYIGEAPENPPAHKDRSASELTFGIPLMIPEGSHLMLYPEHQLEENPFNSTALWRESLDEDQLPENTLREIEPLRVETPPGTAVMFRGSRIYHERFRPANAVVLYLKFNGMRLDPIGEDPCTEPQRARSLALLDSSDDAALLGLRVEASPRLDRVTRLYSRVRWREVIQAEVWGGKPFGLSEFDLAVLKAADGSTQVQDVLRKAGLSEGDAQDYLPALRRLVRLQALDLL